MNQLVTALEPVSSPMEVVRGDRAMRFTASLDAGRNRAPANGRHDRGLARVAQNRLRLG